MTPLQRIPGSEAAVPVEDPYQAWADCHGGSDHPTPGADAFGWGPVRRSTPNRELRGFRKPDGCERVFLTSDEVTTLDKLTNRPDFLTVTIDYVPGATILGSRGLREYYQALRGEGTSIEHLAVSISNDIARSIQPQDLTVTVVEKPRGGIGITAVAKPTWRPAR